MLHYSEIKKLLGLVTLKIAVACALVAKTLLSLNLSLSFKDPKFDRQR